MPAHLYERYQYQPGRTGLYESNYIKANSPDGKRALWIKHNVLAWKNPNREALVELWCILFERGHAPRVWKQELPAADFEFSDDRVELQGDGIHIHPNGTKTRIQDGDREVRWDITISVEDAPLGCPLIHFPFARMYDLPFPKKKVLTPAPRTRWNGTLECDGECIEIENWIGFRNHNWGTEHAFCYAYGNCNWFPDDPDILFDAFSAKIRLGGLLKSPFLSLAVVREGGMDHGFRSIWEAALSDVRIDFPTWKLKLKCGDQVLVATQTSNVEDFVGLPYHHPNGALSYCYNSKFAQTTLEWTAEKGRKRTVFSEFGELEFLFSAPLPDVPVYRSSSSGT